MVLASNSPRRRELLALTGWPFSVMPANVDEDLRPAETPREYVLRLAQSKARACRRLTGVEHAGEAAFILAADTTVVNGKDTLGKPKDAAEAIEMLTALRGHSHQVYTGIALLRLKDGRMLTDVCVTDVPMREYSHEEIVAYVATGDPLDKAGAYAIQHPKFQPVEKLNGCYASVMGLPLCHLARNMQTFEVAPAADVPGNCQSMLNYTCYIFPELMRREHKVIRIHRG
ncbi:MAG: septum formation protein Maf [Anaerolinea sp.]|nr:septum formation protein Maf [Anaerolinea sp.]